MDGSLPFSFNFNHNAAKIGANMRMARGLTDWNHGAGTVKFKAVITLSTCCSARNVNETPACSKHAKKNIPKMQE